MALGMALALSTPIQWLNKRLKLLRVLLKNPSCNYCQKQTKQFELFCPACQAQFNFIPITPTPYSPNEKTPIYAATDFCKTLKQILYPYKFYNKRFNKTVLANILIHYWQKYLTQHPDFEKQTVMVTTVPSRWSNNHLGAIAQLFCQQFNYPYYQNLLQWQRETTPQHKLEKRQDRLNNLVNSMAANLEQRQKISSFERDKGGLSGSLNPDHKPPTILILDDMTTTGATFFEAFRALQQNVNTESSDDTPRLMALALAQVPLKPC